MNSIFLRMRVAITVCILLPLAGAAQETFHGFYANAKAGAGNLFEHNSSIALSVEGGLLRKNNLYSASYLRTEEMDDREVVNSVDLTLGRFKQKGKLIFHYQAGLGVVWGKNEAGFDEPFTTIGLPLKTGIKFVPPNFFSIGLDLQGNLNLEKPMYQVLLTIGVGAQLSSP